ILLLLLTRLTGATYQSLIVAAIFAVHPLRIESVAWVAELKDVLCATFFLLTIACYTQYVRSDRRRGAWYASTAALFALGLMAKPMILTLPCVLLLLDFWPLKRRW